MRQPIRTLTVSVGVCAVFTSAVVVAQATKTGAAQAPAQATAATKIEAKTVAAGAAQKAAAERAEPVKKAPRPAVKGKAIRVVNQNNRAPMIQQCKNQARPAVRGELILVRRVCQLSTEEFRRINRDAQQVVDEVVSKVVDAQLQPRVIGPANAQLRNNLDGSKLLDEALSAVMKKDLTPEQWSRYRVEHDERDAYRKQCTIRFLIDAIDRVLYFSPPQRTKLQDALSSNWESGWQLYVDYLLYGNQFFPMSIDPLLSPILTDAQKAVWQNVQKVDRFTGFGGVWGAFGNDSDELEEELGVEKPKPVIPGMNMRRLQMLEKPAAKRADVKQP